MPTVDGMPYDPDTHARALGVNIIHTHITRSHGLTDGHSTIWLRADLTATETRCTLAHELVHIERGHTRTQPPEVEECVRLETARRLIPLPDLLPWATSQVDPHDIADHLGVTIDVLEDRLRWATTNEKEALHGQGAHRGQVDAQGPHPPS